MGRSQLTSYRRDKVFKMFDGFCAYCGKKLDYLNFNCDHKVAYIKTQDNSLHNLFPSCPQCNMIKGTMDIEEFRNALQTRVMKGVAGHILTEYYRFSPTRVSFYFETLQAREGYNGQK